MSDNRLVYFILETEVSEDGQYIPCIAVEGEQGYHRTNWKWGKDLKLAKQIADERNANLGIDPKEAELIQLRTMCPEPKPFDVVSFIMTVESGEDFSLEYYIDGLAKMIESGVVWQLQGGWQKAARKLIDLGYVDSTGKVLRYK